MAKPYGFRRKESFLVRSLAGYKWLFLQLTKQRVVFEENMGPRAVRWLTILENPSSRLGFRVDLLCLRLEADLVMADSALVDECARLQARVIELADRIPAFEEIRAEMCSKEPLAALFGAVLAQAVTDQATDAKISLTQTESLRLGEELGCGEEPVTLSDDGSRLGGPIHVFYLKPDGWDRAMTIPQNLAKPIRGMIRRVEVVGFTKMRPYFRAAEQQPQDIAIEWESPDVVRIKILK